MEINTSRTPCWKLVLFFVSYCCDILDGKDMSGVGHRNTLYVFIFGALLVKMRFAL